MSWKRTMGNTHSNHEEEEENTIENLNQHRSNIFLDWSSIDFVASRAENYNNRIQYRRNRYLLCTLNSMNDEAWMHVNRGEYDRAEPFLEKSIWLSEKMFGRNAFNTLRSIRYLAQVYEHQGKYDKAEPLYHECISRKERTLGKTHPESIKARIDLLQMFYRQELTSKEMHGYIFFGEVGKKKEKVDKVQDCFSMESIVHQAEMYDEKGEHDKTRQLLQDNLLVKKHDSELNHPHNTLDAGFGSWRVVRRVQESANQKVDPVDKGSR